MLGSERTTRPDLQHQVMIIFCLLVCMCGQVFVKVMYNLGLSCLSCLGLASDAGLARQVSPRDPMASAFLSLGLETRALHSAFSF